MSSSILLDEKRAVAFAFALGVGLRLIPEILAFPLPIGFDTVSYAAKVTSGIVWQHWSSVFASSWLLYALLIPVQSLLHSDPFLLLKVVAPLLYGVSVVGIFYFARKYLSWDLRKSLVAGAFFALNLATLRISWDLLRNTLGFAILLFSLPLLHRVESKRNLAVFALTSVLTVFAHESAAVVLISAVAWMVIRSLRKGESERRLWLILAILPATTFFTFGIYLRMFPIHQNQGVNIISAGDANWATYGEFFFLVNYFEINNGVHHYPTYFDLGFHVAALFALLYLPSLFLIAKGFFRDVILNSWTGILLIGAFGCLFTPFCALTAWHRWMFLLVYPFTFYAVHGLEKGLPQLLGSNVVRKDISKLGSKMKVALLATFLLGSLYLVNPVLIRHFGFGVASTPPVYAYFSSAPTVPYQDVNGVVEAMRWLDGSMNENSCVILQQAFVSWGMLLLDENRNIIEFFIDGERALEVVQALNFDSIFFVWWNTDIDWYSHVELPSGFSVSQNFGRVAVFKYSA